MPPKIIHPKVWASGQPQPEWSSIRRMPTRYERRKMMAHKRRRIGARALATLAFALLAVTAILIVEAMK